jgi:hypothetical protein
MSTNSTAFRRPASSLGLSRTQRAAMGETLLLRFLVQHGLLPAGLLKAADVERRGAGSALSLLDWIVRRGHVSEEQLTLAMAHCLRFAHFEPVPMAGGKAIELTPGAKVRQATPSARHRRLSLRLVHNGPRRAGDSGQPPSASRARPTRPRLRLLSHRPR